MKAGPPASCSQASPARAEAVMTGPRPGRGPPSARVADVAQEAQQVAVAAVAPAEPRAEARQRGAVGAAAGRVEPNVPAARTTTGAATSARGPRSGSSRSGRLPGLRAEVLAVAHAVPPAPSGASAAASQQARMSSLPVARARARNVRSVLCLAPSLQPRSQAPTQAAGVAGGPVQRVGVARAGARARAPRPGRRRRRPAAGARGPGRGRAPRRRRRVVFGVDARYCPG